MTQIRERIERDCNIIEDIFTRRGLAVKVSGGVLGKAQTYQGIVYHKVTLDAYPIGRSAGECLIPVPGARIARGQAKPLAIAYILANHKGRLVSSIMGRV